MRFFFCFFAVVNPVLSSFFLGMGCPILGWDVKNPILGWDVWNIPSWDGMQESHPGMGCMEYPIPGWDARIPSGDVMYGMSQPGMGSKNPILGWDVWDIPSWDGMQ